MGRRAQFGRGGAAIRAYCERPCPDNLLLILAPGLERKDLQTQWAKTVEALGVLVQVWPLKEKELETWLGQRLLAVGFQAGAGVAAAAFMTGFCGAAGDWSAGGAATSGSKLERMPIEMVSATSWALAVCNCAASASAASRARSSAGGSSEP